MAFPLHLQRLTSILIHQRPTPSPTSFRPLFSASPSTLPARFRSFQKLRSMATTTDAPTATAAQNASSSTISEPATKRRKLQGREFYESIGSPRTVVAPMVDQSELAWRLLSRRHSPENTLCYTPMFHSRLFATSPVYRQQSFHPPTLDGAAGDRPVFVQFCSNEPADLLAAAKQVEAHCDAVDLNLGCPQGIARKGHYGAFLQEEPELIFKLIRTLHENLEVPVTAKIRILETKERSLEYAKMVVEAGAQVLTVHGRTREQKGHNTGLADWDYIKYIRDNLPREVVMFANGNILWHEDVERCIAATGVDGVMSAEGNLYNPAIFETSKDWDKRFPRMDKMGREYLDIIRHEILPHLPLQEILAQEPSKRSRKKLNELFKDTNLTAIKSHLFKLWHSLLPRHLDVRNMVGQASTRHMGPGGDPLREYEECQKRVEEIIAEELARNPEEVDSEGRWVGPDREIADGEEVQEGDGFVVEIDGKKFRRTVPWYRCQPYLRPLPEKALEIGAMTAKGEKTQEGGKRNATRKAEDDDADAGPEHKKAKRDTEEVV